MLEYVLLFVTLVLVYKWLDQKPPNFPPGPPTVPIIGSVPFLKYTHFQFLLEELRDKYGPVIGFKFGWHPAVAVCAPDQVLEVLKSDVFQARPSLLLKGRNSNQVEGIFSGSGEKWKILRRFVLRHLRDFGYGKKTVNDMVHVEATEFFEYALEGKSEIEVVNLFNKSSNNVLWAMIAGERIAYDDEEAQVVMEAATSFLRRGNVAGGGIINTVPYLREFLSMFFELPDQKIDKIMNNYFLKTIQIHRETRTDTPRDLIDVYLAEMEKPETQWVFDEMTLVETCRDMLIAGSESSSNTIAFAILYLVLYPEWQDKVFKEIDEVVGKRPPVYEEDRQNLPYFEAFLMETIRSNTIAPLAVPHAPVKDTTISGYSIPKDTFINISIYAVLQDKQHWGDPEKFRPERFIKDGIFVKDPYMIQFSTGPRYCIGETLAIRFTFLFLIHLIQRYKFAVIEGVPKPSTVSVPGFTNAPQPFSVKIAHRP